MTHRMPQMAQQSKSRLPRPIVNSPDFTPKSLFLILAACCASMSIFLGGIIVSQRASTGTHSHIAANMVLAVIAAGVVGRLVSIAVQLEVVTRSAGSIARERAEKTLLLGLVIYAQLPLILRDSLLGIAGWTGLLSYDRTLSLSASIFDPFLLISCLYFIGLLSAQREVEWNRRSAAIAFVGFSIVAKVVEAFLMGFLAHAG
jgi:hypothetical protein